MDIRQLIEKQIIQSAKFIARDQIISDQEKVKAYSDLTELVKQAAAVLGETDIPKWLKQMDVDPAALLLSGEN